MPNEIIHVDDLPHFPNAVYVGRPNPRRGLKGSILGNPFKIGRDGNRAEVIRKYRTLFYDTEAMQEEALRLGREGADWACWCRHAGETLQAGKNPDNHCHADVIAAFVEGMLLEDWEE